MQCQDHAVDMVPYEGRLICPAAGCPRWSAVNPVTDQEQEKQAAEAQKAAEDIAAKEQAKIQEDVAKLHADQ